MKKIFSALVLCLLIFGAGLMLGNSAGRQRSQPEVILPEFTISVEPAASAFDETDLAAVTCIEFDGESNSHGTVISMKSLSVFRNLQELRIRNAEITDLHNLPRLRSLMHLELSNCNLQDIGVIGQLDNLTTLNLADNEITDISPLADLKYLFTLDLSGNNIQSLEPLEPLGFLQELNLSLTSGIVYSPRSASSEETDIPSFEKYTALDRFSSLETLNLSYNGFSTDTHLEFLRGMTSLKALDLSGNDLQTIHFPAELAGLKELNISHNPLTTLENFELLTSLELLDAADTHVHSVDPLAGLKRLRYLYLEADMFADDEPIIESFAPLAGLELLEELSVNVGDVPKLECLVGNKALQVQYFHTLFPSGWMSVDEILRLYQLSAE